MPVEAQAAGTPVIALGKGGALETVRARETGLFFPDQSVESLCGALEDFESLTFDRNAVREHVSSFSRENFRKKFLHTLDSIGVPC